MRRSMICGLALSGTLLIANQLAEAQNGVPASPGTSRASQRPRRKLRGSTAPVLSPALNLLPEVATSFGGQYLMRQLPQEHFLKADSQANRNLENLQNQISEQDVEIKTGLSKTGHTAAFLNYGRYYPMGQGRGGGGGGRH
jgi:hypothetical protein